MAQAPTQTNNKWKTAQGTGNVYTTWDSNIIVRDSADKMVQLNQKLKKEDQYEEKIGPNWYKVRDSNGAFLIYAENEQKHQERSQKQSSGFAGKNKDDWYKVVDIYTTEDRVEAVYKITQEKWSLFGRSFREATQAVNGKLVYGLVKREKIQPGGSQADGAGPPTESAPPV